MSSRFILFATLAVTRGPTAAIVKESGQILAENFDGGMAEWSMAVVLKTIESDGLRVPTWITSEDAEMQRASATVRRSEAVGVRP